ncbi:MAG: hypothetical protein ABI906_08125 [Pseudomonadota bacterium]
MAKTTLYLLLLVALSGCSPSPNAARVADTVVSKASTSPMSEEQATAYIYNAGYRDIKGLIRDDGGAWHGQATKGGRTTRVTVDREGAVTSG